MIYVGSLTFSPVYKSHCCAFGAACEESGVAVKYLFSGQYEWMLPEKIKEKTIFIGNTIGTSNMLKDYLNSKNRRLIIQALIRDKPTHVYLLNYHLLDHFFSKLRNKYSFKLIYHAHEPHVDNKRAHGMYEHYFYYLSEFLETRLLKGVDTAIVSSKEGSRLFDKTYPWFHGKRILIPLLYEDINKKQIGESKPTYITFIGPTVPSKGPDIFVRIMDYASKENPDWQFLLISRRKVTDPIFHNRPNLITFDTCLSDEEYGRLIRNSMCVLAPYKRETQSSTVLVSYMYGTPVVSSNVGGLPEFVNHKNTGFLVDVNAVISEWVEAIKFVSENYPRLSSNCRQYFIGNFAGKNWRKYLSALLT